MALFGSARDRSLLRRVNREMMRKILSIEVAVYKMILEDTKTNIYGESDSKQYYRPVRVSALVEDNGSSMSTSVFDDIEKIQEISVGFLRDDLIDLDLRIEEGDIFFWDGKYYEVDRVGGSTNSWWSRSQNNNIPIQEGDVADHGYNIAVNVDAHRTNITNLNIVETRSGNNSITNESKLRNL